MSTALTYVLIGTPPGSYQPMTVTASRRPRTVRRERDRLLNNGWTSVHIRTVPA